MRYESGRLSQTFGCSEAMEVEEGTFVSHGTTLDGDAGLPMAESSEWDVC